MLLRRAIVSPHWVCMEATVTSFDSSGSGWGDVNADPMQRCDGCVAGYCVTGSVFPAQDSVAWWSSKDVPVLPETPKNVVYCHNGADPSRLMFLCVSYNLRCCLAHAHSVDDNHTGSNCWNQPGRVDCPPMKNQTAAK